MTNTRTASAPAAPVSGAATGVARRRSTRAAGWVVALVILAVAVLASLAIGSRTIDPRVVLSALLGTDTGSADAVVVIDLRLPRTIVGLAAGLALGLAGGLIQAVTRNPLADPGILGVTSGAAFAVAIAVGVLGITQAQNYLWFAFGGALVATVLVYAVGSSGRGGGSPVRLTLTGVALGAVLSGITSGMLLADPRGFSAMQAWRSGSLQDRGWDSLVPVAPFLVVGVVLAFVIARPLNAVALGDDLAASLGANVTAVRVIAVVAVTLLAGGSTAIAGPIAFVGLAVPHIARWIVGPDQRWILAYTLVLSPVLLLLADVVGRVVMPPGELPAGIVTAALGAPVLIYLVRRSKAISL